jgi:6-pyruvoyltetrahydropterin/6-carboxytetrahydropterin synthase
MTQRFYKEYHLGDGPGSGAALDDDAVADRLAGAGERELHIGRDRPIRFSAGHRLLRHEGKCSRPHGHNYEVRVRLTGELGAEGWVVDKGDVTAVIGEWDHRFLVEDGDPLAEGFEASGDSDALVVLDAPPTAEVMSVLLEEKLSERLPDRVADVAVEVSETSELCAGGI